jgi:hypothetical protein
MIKKRGFNLSKDLEGIDNITEEKSCDETIKKISFRVEN